MKTETQQLIDALLIRFSNRAEKWNMLSIETTEEPKLTYALARKREANSAIGVLQDEVKKLVKQIEQDNATPATESGCEPVNVFPLRDIPAGDPFFAPAFAEWIRVGCSPYELTMQDGTKITEISYGHRDYPLRGKTAQTGRECWTLDGFYATDRTKNDKNLILRYVGSKQEPIKYDQLDFVKIANEILAGEGKYTLQTEQGKPVTVIGTNGREPYVIIGYRGANENPGGWKKDGSFCGQLPANNLVAVPIPPKVVGYVNVYNNSSSQPYRTKEEANNRADKERRIACIEVKEGDGL